MAFKRYIHKHGKKLGPYYYENVRGPDGSVKTVYLGTNPNHHPKHRIRKPLFFLIVVLVLILILGGALFFLQNKAYLIKKVSLQQADFEIDQILLKVLIRSNEFIEKQVRIMNTGNDPAAIDVQVLGLPDIVNVDAPSFTIKPGQTKIIGLNFSSFVPEQKIEHHPGIYVGKLLVKSHKAAKEVPIVVEIETKNVLFDMNLNPVAIERKVKQGSDTTIEVRLFNLESIESVSVDVEYFVKDMNGNTIITESETVVAKTQASFFKTISIPEKLKPGPYVFAAAAKFGSSIGTASYLFEVIGPEAEASFVGFCKNSVMCLGLSITTILLLFAVIAYFYFFVGAYLYEKVTGAVALPRKRREEEIGAEEEAAEGLEEGIFDRIINKIYQWKEEREGKKAEKEGLEREEEVQRVAGEGKLQVRRPKEARPSKKLSKFYKTMDEAIVNINKKDAYGLKRLYIKARDLYINIPKREKPEAYDKLLQLYEQKNKLIEEVGHEEGLRKKEEEAFRKTEEKRKLDEERKRKSEEENRQKGLERQRALAEKSRLEEERKRKEEEEKRQKELEKQRQEQIKAQKLELVKQLEEKLRKNKELYGQLNSELKKIESEKRSLSRNISEIESKANEFDKEILRKNKQIEELNQQKNSLHGKYQKKIGEIAKKEDAEKSAVNSKINELKAIFAEKQNALMKGLEEELSKLSPAKREKTEKWKRMELKAKLKLDEHSLEEELKEYEIKESDEKKKAEEDYKNGLEAINKKQQALKDEASSLETQKQQILSEKGAVPRELQSKDNEIGSIKLKLENLSKEREQLNSELSQLRAELGFRLDFFKNLISGYKEKAEKARREGQEKRAMLEEEKGKKEELRELGKREAKLREIEDERKRQEEERLKEELKLEKELKKKEKSIKLKEIEEKPIEEAKEKLEEKKPGFFEKLFKREKTEAKEPELKIEEGYEAPKEKPEVKRLKSEAEDLEEAIRSLGLFKEVEKGKSIEKKPSLFKGIFKKEEAVEKEVKTQPKEGVFGKLFKKPGKGKIKEEKKPIFEGIKEKLEEKKSIERKKPEKKIIGKSKKFVNCHKALQDAKAAIAEKDVANAKKLYLKARELYVELDYREKKEIYDELTELYNRL